MTTRATALPPPSGARRDARRAPDALAVSAARRSAWRDAFGVALANRLIGRGDDCARLETLVAGGGTITLIGPGGVGKTRLARELAVWREEFGETVPVAHLAGLPSGATPAAVAAELGYESVDAAIVGFSERPGTIVLDNCEHVVPAVSSFVGSLRDAVVDVVVVATSREPLGIDHEHLVPVEPLPLPSPGGHDADRSPAVELFLDRARAAGAMLEPSPRLLSDVGELCRRLDGLPLAIELAAARTRAVAPNDLLEVVDQRLDLLRRTRTEGGDRHDSMRAAIDVSTSLLSPPERAFFRRLGVFTGPFDLGLAHAVAAEPDAARLDTIDTLTELVDRSLVTAETDGGHTRYRLLELLREHALDEVRRADELSGLEERFVEAMTAVADHIVAESFEQWGPSQLAAASSQFTNLTTAVELCLERDQKPDRAIRLVLPMFAAVHEGHASEVAAIGSRVLERWPDDVAPWRPEALAVLASASALADRPRDVEALAVRVVSDPEASPLALAFAERAWGLAVRAHDPAEAAAHFRRAGEAATAAGFSPIGREVRVFEAGQVDLAGDSGRALELLAVSSEECRAAGDLLLSTLVHLVRACVLMRSGALGDADGAVAAAEADMTAMRQPWWTAATLRTRAALTALQPGGWHDAAPLWREAVDFAASKGAIGEIAIQLRTAASIAEYVGETQIADTLYSAAPPSTAITVLPELFPQCLAAVRARAQPGPSAAHPVEAIAQARAALDRVPDVQRPSPDDEPVMPASAPIVPSDSRESTAQLVAEGDTWRVLFNGRAARMRDAKGLGDLAVLLSRPRTDIHALELMGGHDVGAAPGPVVDDVARRAYQERMIELQREIDEARDANDPARADRAEIELDALVEQLSEAFGIGGRARSSGSSAERARTAVTYRIRSAIRRLDQVHPELARHLGNSVRTGTWCSYRPEQDVRWTIDRGR